MNLQQFEKRLKLLEKVINQIEGCILNFPGGNLRVSKSGKKIQYYYVTQKGDRHGKYIRKKDRQLAVTLAKRDYYREVLKAAKHEKEITEYYMKEMYGMFPEDVYAEMIENRRMLVNPILLSDDEYEREWLNEEYDGNPYHPEEKVYTTKRGDMVRSKSEAMIADMYFDMGIPYRYEYPLKLYNGTVRYPDFTVLKLPERKVIYHEHMGILEDDEYRKRNLIKISDYSKTGINLGDNLIITYETEYLPFDQKTIRGMMKKVFCGR